MAKEFLRYDEETGLFHWINGNARRKAGEVAGSINSDGYIKIGINGGALLAHRLAWFFLNGCIPKFQIDHINRNKTDNRPCNLREATTKQNSENKSIRSDNTSGHVGVYKNARGGKYKAVIYHFGKHIYLGSFDTKEEAAFAHDAKAAELFTHV